MGEGFAAARLPDPTADDNIFKHRGRGVHIARELMDECRFSGVRAGPDEHLAGLISEEEARNRGQLVLLVKYLDA